MNKMDYYEIIGVSRTATPDEIKSRYRELVKKFHPDSHVSNPLADLAAEKFKEIQEAYSVLIDPDKRRAYDHGAQDQSFSSSSYESIIAEAERYGNLRLWPQSEAECERAIRLQPDRWEAYATKGAVYAEQERYNEAVLCYRKAADRGADSGGFFNCYGVSLLESGQYDKAIAYFDRAIRMDGEIPLYVCNLAICYERMNRTDLANQYWSRLQKIDPSNDVLKVRENQRQLQNQRNFNAGVCFCAVLEAIFDCC